MVRIRYSKNDKGQLVTKQMLVVNEMLTGVITLLDFSYSLVTNDGTVRAEGSANTLMEAQKTLKHELKALGMVFSDEVRAKKELLKTESQDDVLTHVEL